MEMIEDKTLFVYDYVNLKNRELVRKHGKKRSLGDIDGKYRYHAPKQTPSLMGSLINLDFPETRAINTTSAGAIIADQSKQIKNTYQKTFRNSTLQVWSRPESSLEDRPYSSMDNRPGTAPEDTLDLQPSVNNRGGLPRPHTTGSHSFRTPPRQPPHPSGFMVVKMKPDGSVKNQSIRTVTEQIHDWWERDDRKQRERARRAHSQNIKRYDSFAGQWLSFAGNVTPRGVGQEEQEEEGDLEGGVIEAFTGKVPASDEFYNIESTVGASVATQLRTGNKVRVGVNGELQSDSLKVKKWRNEEETESSSSNSNKEQSVDDIFREARAEAPNVTPLRKEGEGRVRKKAPEDLIPLSWSEQVSKPNVKVMGMREASDPPLRYDLSERHPVVFHPLLKDGARPHSSVQLGKYRINQQSRSKVGIDGTESLNNRITRITVDMIDRKDGGNTEPTDEDYENLLKERMSSVNVDDYDDEDNHDVEGERQVSPRRTTGNMQEESMYSIGKESDMSGLTVEKPATIGLQESREDLMDSAQGSPPRGSPLGRPHPRQVASATPIIRHTQSADPRLRAPPRSMARSAGSQRMQPPESAGQPFGPSSAGTQRTMSSASSRRKYSFDQKVTPRNAHSPRPNLARPGHLPRTKVPSIATGPQEGDAEYIQISQQIPRPGDGRSWNEDTRLSPISRMNDMNLLHMNNGDTPEPSISSLDDQVSVDSMNVQRGDRHQEKGHYHEDGVMCTCTKQAKRVMSAALSAMSHVTSDHSIINIPTAPMTPSESDRNSLSDMDPLSSTSTFRRTSFGEDEWKESYDHSAVQDLAEQVGNMSAGHVAESGDHAGPDYNGSKPPRTEVTSPTPSREIVINKHDGLDSLGITPPRSAGKKRTVKFSDEVNEPFVPYTSPMSTPRDPAHPGSVEGSLNSGEFVAAQDRKDLTAADNATGSGAASRELSDLRAKIKSDLQQSQAETEQDLHEMKSLSDAK